MPRYTLCAGQCMFLHMSRTDSNTQCSPCKVHLTCEVDIQ
jgi:hypothetical protein